MPTSTITKYKIYCITEDCWKYKWDTNPITKCPDDTTHNVNPDSVLIDDVITNNTVIVSSEPDVYKTGGHYRTTTAHFMANPNSVTIHETTFPYPIALSCVQIHASAENIGDIVDCCAPPPTVVGILTQPAQIDSTVLFVSPTVIANVAVGYYITLTDGTNTDECGAIISIDANNGTIKIENKLGNNYNQNTFVKMAIYFIKDYYINIAGFHKFAYNKIGSSYLPENTVGRIYYKNNSQNQKMFCLMTEFFY